MTQNYFDPAIELASRDYLHALQSARLIKMVENCYNNVPFYKKKFDEIGLLPGDIHSIDDITKLPFTVKQDLRDNYPFGLFAVSREKLQRIHASSGTTGKQTVVGYTKHDIDVWAHGAARAIAAAGGKKTITFTFLTATAFSPAVWGFTTVQNCSAQRSFRFLPATPNAKYRFCRISAPISCAARRLMPCISANR